MNLIDFSQILMASIYMGESADCVKHPSQQSKDMIKHSIISSLKWNWNHHKEYGQMVLCCDSGSWRYDVFPQYKWKRKQKKENDDSGIDWNFVTEVREELIDDLRKYFPYPVIQVKKAEGDDIIAVLAVLCSKTRKGEPDIFGNVEQEKILITSSDRDNFQLQLLGKHVKQWSPMDKKLVKPEGSVRHALIEKIVKGDPGDGVVNIKSHDNFFVEGIGKQKPISAKYLQTFFEAANPIDACLTEEEKINYKRNETLVSYAKIPTEIRNAIIECYNTECAKEHSKSGLMNYLSQNKMVNLLTNIHDFY